MSFTSLIPRSRKLLIFQCVLASLIGLLLVSIARTTNIKFFSHNNDSLQQQNIQLVDSKPYVKPQKYPYTIVTGSSANHICSLENFLYSIHSFRSEIDKDQFPRIAVYNIGMNRTQLPVLNQLKENGLIDDLITFDHERYPSFWDVAIEAGQYGWKTGIVNDARVRYGGVLVWLDAGNQVTKEFLLEIPDVVKSEQFHGFWSPKSDHGMGKWTHPGMFKYFNVDPKPYRYKSNCNGAAIGFDTDNATIVNTLIVPWFECGLVKKCIAPPGSSRANHRQDQAALTFLAYLNGHECTTRPSEFNLQTHRDQSCRSTLMELDLQDKLYHPSAIDSVKWERVDTIALYNHPEWKYAEDDVPVNIRQPVTPL